MTLFAASLLTVTVNVVLAMLGLAVLLSLVRLIRGPSLPDRVVALDLIGTITVGIIGTYCVMSNQRVFLIVAVVLALITFLGTVALAYYVEKGGTE